MNRRLPVSCIAIALFVGVINTPTASAQQSINFLVGAFVPRGFDGRDIDDVLYQNAGFLDFRMKDFNGATVGAEYLVQLNDFFDAGLGVGIYSRTVRTADLDFQHANGDLVEQDIKLRMVPVTATFRFLPLGHHDAIVPYVGGGVGIYRWRYSEIGEFVDRNENILNGRLVASGTAVGPVVLGGVRIPVGGRGSGFGGEIRWQGGKGDLPLDQDFVGRKIDLGGFNYLFTINVGF